MAADSKRSKHIFISDIHLGDKRSWEGAGHEYPYVWTAKNTAVLAEFLGKVAQSRDVKEVVVLGDLFDQWIVPSDSAPCITLDEICGNPKNDCVIEKLNELLRSGIELVYVPGNHDMPYSMDDIPIRKSFLQKTFPGIK